MKNVIGDKNRRSQSVGMSLTSMKNAVKMAKIRRRLPRKRIPEKLRRERFARLAKRPATTKRKKRKPRMPQPTKGRSMEI